MDATAIVADFLVGILEGRNGGGRGGEMEGVTVVFGGGGAVSNFL